MTRLWRLLANGWQGSGRSRLRKHGNMWDAGRARRMPEIWWPSSFCTATTPGMASIRHMRRSWPQSPDADNAIDQSQARHYSAIFRCLVPRSSPRPVGQDLPIRPRPGFRPANLTIPLRGLGAGGVRPLPWRTFTGTGGRVRSGRGGSFLPTVVEQGEVGLLLLGEVQAQDGVHPVQDPAQVGQ